MFNSYEELTKLYVELSNAYDARLSILRDLEKLVLLNPFIILLIVIENNHNLILNQQGTYAPFALKHHYPGSPSRSQEIQFELS